MLRDGGLWLPLASLDGILFHRYRPIDRVQLEIQTTSITDRLTGRVATPQRGSARLAVGAVQSGALRGGMQAA